MEQKVFADSYLMSNSGNFNVGDIPVIKSKLAEMAPDRQTSLQMANIKNPVVALLLSLFLGSLGIDRFYLGDIGVGIAKLLTFGGFGLWTLIDWFLVMDRARKKNFETIMRII